MQALIRFVFGRVPTCYNNFFASSIPHLSRALLEFGLFSDKQGVLAVSREAWNLQLTKLCENKKISRVGEHVGGDAEARVAAHRENFLYGIGAL